MTSEQFCYWLQGYFELKKIEHGEVIITPLAAKAIDDHLQTVFHKVTPTYQLPSLPRQIGGVPYQSGDPIMITC